MVERRGKRLTRISGDNIRNVFFISDKEGWLIGERNMIAHTTDGGRTWDRQYAGAQHMLNGIFFVTPQKGWAVGELGTVIHTADGGKSWVPQTPTEFNSLKGAFFLNEKEGWVVGWARGCLSHKEWWIIVDIADLRNLQRTVWGSLYRQQSRLDRRSVR